MARKLKPVDDSPICATAYVKLVKLSEKQILAWADDYFASTGKWPKEYSGPIAGTGESWGRIAAAMRQGRRGLRRGYSLPRLLSERRHVRHQWNLPRLSERRILAWAGIHRKATGQWPTVKSGPVASSPGENWQAINNCLVRGCRGLRGGSSLAKLLSKHRVTAIKQALPRFKLKQILAWAKHYRAETGRRPTAESGPVAESPGDTWLKIDMALEKGVSRPAGRFQLVQAVAEERTEECVIWTSMRYNRLVGRFLPA